MRKLAITLSLQFAIILMSTYAVAYTDFPDPPYQVPYTYNGETYDYIIQIHYGQPTWHYDRVVYGKTSELEIKRPYIDKTGINSPTLRLNYSALTPPDTACHAGDPIIGPSYYSNNDGVSWTEWTDGGWCSEGGFYYQQELPTMLRSNIDIKHKEDWTYNSGEYSDCTTFPLFCWMGTKYDGDVVITASAFGGGGQNNFDHFTWPIGLPNSSNGHFGSCNEGTCYWLSDIDETVETVWRDAQPFQLYKYKGKYHLGADYNIGGQDDDLGEPVYPTSVGRISNVLENECGFGNIIFVKHETSFGTYTSVYAHVDWLESGKPEIDDEVTPENPIAYIGKGCWNNKDCKKNKKGCYTAHLHFEIREGDDTAPGLAYSKYQLETGPEGQFDPNEFISLHR